MMTKEEIKKMNNDNTKSKLIDIYDNIIDSYLKAAEEAFKKEDTRILMTILGYASYFMAYTNKDQKDISSKWMNLYKVTSNHIDNLMNKDKEKLVKQSEDGYVLCLVNKEKRYYNIEINDNKEAIFDSDFDKAKRYYDKSENNSDIKKPYNISDFSKVTLKDKEQTIIFENTEEIKLVYILYDEEKVRNEKIQENSKLKYSLYFTYNNKKYYLYHSSDTGYELNFDTSFDDTIVLFKSEKEATDIWNFAIVITAFDKEQLKDIYIPKEECVFGVMDITNKEE